MPLLLYVCWRNPRHFTRRLVTRHLRFPLCVVPNRFRCANGTSSSSFFGSSWPPQRFRLYLADGEREPNRNTQSLLCHHLRIERLSWSISGCGLCFPSTCSPKLAAVMYVAALDVLLFSPPSLSLTAAEITRCKKQTAEFIKDSKRPGDRTGRNAYGCHSFPGKKFLPRFVCVEGNREGGMCLSSCKEKKKRENARAFF